MLGEEMGPEYHEKRTNRMRHVQGTMGQILTILKIIGGKEQTGRHSRSVSSHCILLFFCEIRP